MKFSLCVLSFVCVFNLSFAAVPTDSVVSKCSVTPELENIEHLPYKFNLSNNLRRKTGAFESAAGTNISIYGRLLDKNCLPITDAVIEVWQTNSHGVYQQHESAGGDPEIDPHFIGNGTTSTNNLGQFHFITILPGSYKGNTPFINITVTFPSQKSFSTKIYFSNGRIIDEAVNNIPEASRSLLLANPYNHQINKNFEIPHEGKMAGDKIYIIDIVAEDKLVSKIY